MSFSSEENSGGSWRLSNQGSMLGMLGKDSSNLPSMVSSDNSVNKGGGMVELILSERQSVCKLCKENLEKEGGSVISYGVDIFFDGCLHLWFVSYGSSRYVSRYRSRDIVLL